MNRWTLAIICVVMAWMSVARAGVAGDIEWIVPQDGGTPREAGRIEAVGEREFKIRARDEERTSNLTHAVSRVDLVCRNRSVQPQEVTVHIDVSGDGKRTNDESSYFGGMMLRDFLFIQPAGGAWKQVEGKTAGWVITVSFKAEPGETRLGLSPWYTYGDYVNYVRSLAAHPHLKKERVKTSDGGREHWELTITDPSVEDGKKRRVLWHARSHAYETFSSYAMEGAVAWLLSDAAAEARRQFVFILHPMSNVDGVADGAEYGGGCEQPHPRATASGRLIFEATDRVKPNFFITWHNWIAPREVDCVFYTDAENGKPTRRAWDVFTQRFRSPRAFGHRWEDETQPERKNWAGRKLSESNVHQYAMKWYGTKVWGWEMPWWGRTTADARRAGGDFAKAWIETQRIIESKAGMVHEDVEPVEVARWEMHEFTLNGKAHVDNPFRDAALIGEFRSPSGKVLSVEGFFDGGDRWKLRFTPEEAGEWKYVLRGEGVELFQRGRLKCVAAGDKKVEEQVDAAFEMVREAVRKGEVPGAIALVIRNGRVVRHEATGVSDPERGVPFTTNTICWIASITKPVTVAAAMTLVEEGKLSLQDTVEKYLPEFCEQQGPDGKHYPVTIYNIMTHTSGIVPNPPTRRPGWPIGGALDETWLTAKLPEIVSSIAKSKLKFVPGSQDEYSNSSLFVLGRVMEVVTGKPYAQVVKERILDPLGMKDSYYAPPGAEAGRVSPLFRQDRTGPRTTEFRFNPELSVTNAAPDGGLFSYPAEMAKFYQMFLDNDGKVLSKDTVREMLKEQRPGRGLAWALDDGVFYHGGSSGTNAFGDLRTGVFGALFFQFRDRKDRVTELKDEFQRRVIEAYREDAGMARGRGFVRVHPQNPYAFAYADGTPYFPMGDTCYGLYNDSTIKPELRTQYLKTRRAQGFNFIRVGVQHSPTRWEKDARYWPWGGTPKEPDFDRFNPEFFQGLDNVLRELNGLGINAELIALNFYHPPMNDTKVWTPERERAWLRYLAARVAAFPNLFMWTIANEYETHPDGRYFLDEPGDPDWAKATARFIKAHDCYRHLVTVHPVVSASGKGGSPRNPFDPPWRIGEFFGRDDAMDVISQQTGQPGQWDEARKCITGDDPTLAASLHADRKYKKPVLNTENGYEYLKGFPDYRKQVHDTDKVRRSSWRIACAGGYFAAGFAATTGQNDSWNKIDAPNRGRYQFAIRDEGAAAQLRILKDFFDTLPFWKMEPFDGVKNAAGDAVALADQGKVYVVYLPHGGEVEVDLGEVKGTMMGELRGEWFNPRNGEVSKIDDLMQGKRIGLKAPGEGDWVLRLSVQGQ